MSRTQAPAGQMQVGLAISLCMTWLRNTYFASASTPTLFTSNPCKKINKLFGGYEITNITEPTQAMTYCSQVSLAGHLFLEYFQLPQNFWKARDQYLRVSNSLARVLHYLLLLIFFPPLQGVHVTEE